MRVSSRSFSQIYYYIFKEQNKFGEIVIDDVTFISSKSNEKERVVLPLRINFGEPIRRYLKDK